MTWLGKLLKGGLGWKTVTGAAVIFIAVIGQATGYLSPDNAQKLIHLAEGIGLIGLRDAIEKLKK